MTSNEENEATEAAKGESKTTAVTLPPPQKKTNTVEVEVVKEEEEEEEEEELEKYHAVIVDSGAIIKHAGYSTLHNAASSYYTVPGVLTEIRDAKARQHLESLPFELQTKSPSPLACEKIVEFARLTGDYGSLSSVDVQVLALLYDLEMEGCNGNMDHIRAKPKHKLGLGKIHPLNPNDGLNNNNNNNNNNDTDNKNKTKKEHNTTKNDASFFEQEADYDTIHHDDDDENEQIKPKSEAAAAAAAKPKAWAALVNPNEASSTTPFSTQEEEKSLSSKFNNTLQITSPSSSSENENIKTAVISFSEIQQEQAKEEKDDEEGLGGQFSDAEEEEEKKDTNDNDDDDNDGEQEGLCIANQELNDDINNVISDEECDVYILDPEELDEKLQKKNDDDDDGVKEYETLNDYHSTKNVTTETTKVHDDAAAANNDDDLNSDFPSLTAASTVPYEGSDDEDDNDDNDENKHKNDNSTNAPTKEKILNKRLEDEEKRKQQSLQPKAPREGLRYNSFRKYGHVISKKGVAATRDEKRKAAAAAATIENKDLQNKEKAEAKNNNSFFGADGNNSTNTDKHQQQSTNHNQSRIIGGMTMSGQGSEVEDDGEGWITCSKDIRSMKASGNLDPTRTPNNPQNNNHQKSKKPTGPPISQRSACATTDFAMQNVILQMNLELLTVDGTKIKKLKSWVTRCGACYAIYANDEKEINGKKMTSRLFCDKCGSDFLQRVAASVDKKTGRLRLHLKKNYKHNIRGTKFSLPKPGTGNRFEGDLLLREDQLMMGAWNQKVKKYSGKKAAQSMFGSDLADNVGCHADLSKRSDIKVGFGRKNPNSSKFGRERRGKKKKSTDKACGVRRY